MADAADQAGAVEAPEEAPEASEETSPAEINDALQQLNSRFDSIEGRLPAEENGGEPRLEDLAHVEADEQEPQDELYGDEQLPDEDEFADLTEALGPEPDLEAEEAQAAEAFEQAIQERVEAGLAEHEARRIAEERVAMLDDFVEEHPDANEMASDIRRTMERAELLPQDYPADPRHVSLVYHALKGREAMEAEQAQAEEAAKAKPERGPHLERGAGPGMPEPKVDPVEQAYLKAIQGEDATNTFVK